MSLCSAVCRAGLQEFKIGLLSQLRAPLRLLPPPVLAGAAGLLVAVLAAVAYRRA